jgi:hypothetical protein
VEHWLTSSPQFPRSIIRVPSSSYYSCIYPLEFTVDGQDEEVITGNLQRVENAAVAKAYVDPEFNIDNYEKILIDPLDVSSVSLTNPDFTRSASNWELVYADAVFLADRFRISMIKNFFGLGGYKAASKPGPGVLRIQVKLSRVGPANIDGPGPGSVTMRSRSNLKTRGGEVQITGYLQEAETGKVMLRFTDVRASAKNWALKNQLADREDAKLLFESWARLFVFRLQENRKITREQGKSW